MDLELWSAIDLEKLKIVLLLISLLVLVLVKSRLVLLADQNEMLNTTNFSGLKKN
jgi:hypothetical protein